MTSEQQSLIDRMVDGELSDQEQRELLLSCEQQRWWRALALAYVESQALGVELNLLLEETAAQPSKISVSRKNTSRPVVDWRLLSLAAAVLVSLGLGYGLAWIVRDAPTSSPGNEIVAGNVESAVEGGEAGLPSMRFTVRDPSTNRLRQIDLPIVKASDLGPNWLQQLSTDLPNDHVQEIRGRGLNISRTRTFTPVDLSDGRRVVVPIDYYIEQTFQ